MAKTRKIDNHRRKRRGPLGLQWRNKMKPDSRHSIMKLSPEVLYEILQYLHNKDLGNVALTCSWLCENVRDNASFDISISQLSLEAPAFQAMEYKRVRSLLISNYPFPELPHKLHLSSLQRLEVGASVCQSLIGSILEKTVHLQHLTFGNFTTNCSSFFDGSFEDGDKRVIKSFQTIDHLGINENISYVPEGDYQDRDINWSKFFDIPTSSLTSLQLTINSYCPHEISISQVMIEWISRKTSLRLFHLTEHLPLSPTLHSMEPLIINSHLKNAFKKIKLSKVILNVYLGNIPFWIDFLETQSQLNELHLSATGNFIALDLPLLQNVFVDHLQNIQILSLQLMAPLDMELLAKLPRLTVLNIQKWSHPMNWNNIQEISDNNQVRNLRLMREKLKVLRLMWFGINDDELLSFLHGNSMIEVFVMEKQSFDLFVTPLVLNTLLDLSNLKRFSLKPILPLNYDQQLLYSSRAREIITSEEMPFRIFGNLQNDTFNYYDHVELSDYMAIPLYIFIN